MEKRKVILDREPISSNDIRSKQNFGEVVKGYHAMKPPLWKTAWFYGPVGMAVIAVTVAIVKYNPDETLNDNDNIAYDEINTIAKKEITPISAQNITTPVMAAISGTNKSTVKTEEKKQPSRTFNSLVRQEEIVEELNALNTETESPEIELITVQKEVEPLVSEITPTKEEETNWTSTRNILPSIAGVFNGQIRINQLTESPIVEINKDWEVVQFNIQYYNGVQDVIERVKGNQIPENIMKVLTKHNRNQMVFITEVFGKNKNGEVKSFNSMNIIPIY